MTRNKPLQTVEAIVLLGILLAFLLPAFFPGEPESDESFLPNRSEAFSINSHFVA